MRKRVIFQRPDGLMQIMGTSDDFPDGQLPVTAENFYSLGDVIPFASLVRVTPRAAIYKTPIVPQARDTFHEAQK